MIKKFVIAVMIITINSFAEDFTWPHHTKCAVCLTFDDNLASQLDIAVPMLDKAGFKGTFYSIGNAPELANRMQEWRIAAANGHELGNHTLFHPCLEKTRGETRDWLMEHRKLENYDIPRIMDEVLVANTLLYAIDGKTERTFAYTCCDTYVGKHKSFIDDLAKYFPAARGIGDVPNSMADVDVMNAESIAAQNKTGEEMIAYVQKARQNGTLAVFLFHGVDEGHLPVAAAELQILVNYLAENRDTIWTDTFLNVMKYVSAEQN